MKVYGYEFRNIVEDWQNENKTKKLPLPIHLYFKYIKDGVEMSRNDWKLSIDFNHYGCDEFEYRISYNKSFGEYLRNFTQKYENYVELEEIEEESFNCVECCNCNFSLPKAKVIEKIRICKCRKRNKYRK